MNNNPNEPSDKDIEDEKKNWAIFLSFLCTVMIIAIVCAFWLGYEVLNLGTGVFYE